MASNQKTFSFGVLNKSSTMETKLVFRAVVSPEHYVAGHPLSFSSAEANAARFDSLLDVSTVRYRLAKQHLPLVLPNQLQLYSGRTVQVELAGDPLRDPKSDKRKILNDALHESDAARRKISKEAAGLESEKESDEEVSEARQLLRGMGLLEGRSSLKKFTREAIVGNACNMRVEPSHLQECALDVNFQRPQVGYAIVVDHLTQKDEERIGQITIVFLPDDPYPIKTKTDSNDP